MKQGYKTTEFWAMVGSVLVAVAINQGWLSPGEEEAANTIVNEFLLAAAGVVTYIYSRGVVKSKQ